MLGASHCGPSGICTCSFCSPAKRSYPRMPRLLVWWSSCKKPKGYSQNRNTSCVMVILSCHFLSCLSSTMFLNSNKATTLFILFILACRGLSYCSNNNTCQHAWTICTSHCSELSVSLHVTFFKRCQKAGFSTARLVLQELRGDTERVNTFLLPQP